MVGTEKADPNSQRAESIQHRGFSHNSFVLIAPSERSGNLRRQRRQWEFRAVRFPFWCEGNNLEKEKQFLIGLFFLSKANFRVWTSLLIQQPSKGV